MKHLIKKAALALLNFAKSTASFLHNTMEQQRASNVALINTEWAFANSVVNNDIHGSYH